ncbi:hypothetical protein HMPREF0183_0401 [Brevibacterium mcbrellneri ATCC 49030]|uniref:Uncharacterized protein n=1 Tax=Brevibacterium mcbrellneri ATCC 49030 TaxID=585530 RepID=D4YKE1_9MICO|nr:hypothetical protein HMPREF0183_0401 [Brevibacterium mcbrellneri ATCC 49030]
MVERGIHQKVDGVRVVRGGLGGESRVKTAFGYSPDLGLYPNDRFCSLRVKKLAVSLQSSAFPVLDCSQTHPSGLDP